MLKQDKAEAGVAWCQEALRHLEDINTRVHQVGEVMVEVTAASQQQSQEVAQINTAMAQLNQTTQQTAAHSQESASAAEALSGQAHLMRDMVATFQLTNTAGGTGVLPETTRTTDWLPACQMPGDGEERHVLQRV